MQKVPRGKGKSWETEVSPSPNATSIDRLRFKFISKSSFNVHFFSTCLASNAIPKHEISGSVDLEWTSSSAMRYPR